MRYANERNEDDGQQWAAKNEEPRPIVIGKISHWRLDNKGQKATYPYHQADLCQCEGKLLDKYRKKGVNKGDIEIPNEMNEAEAKDYLQISFSLMFHHNNK